MAVKVAVLGPGGVGGFLAAMLSHAGDDVLVIAREETARDIERGGLRLESGRYGTFEARVRTAERLHEPVEAVLVTVKATHLDDAMARVPASALGDAIVVPFLNGFEHVDRLRREYPADSVAAATIRIETARVAPGVIRHTSPFATIEIAGVPANRERVERLAARLAGAGIDTTVRDDERAMLWEKFGVLEPMALLTTRERASIGVARTARRDDLENLVAELVDVAQAEGVTLDRDKIVAFIDAVPASMESSMQRDDAAGRPLELDALGGALIRRAEIHEIDVPITRRISGEISERAPRRGPSRPSR